MTIPKSQTIIIAILTIILTSLLAWQGYTIIKKNVETKIEKAFQQGEQTAILNFVQSAAQTGVVEIRDAEGNKAVFYAEAIVKKLQEKLTMPATESMQPVTEPMQTPL